MKLKTRFKRAYNGFIGKSAGDMNDFFDFLGLRDVPADVLSEATYFACLKVLSEALGKLPLKLLQYTNNHGVVTTRDHPLLDWFTTDLIRI